MLAHNAAVLGIPMDPYWIYNPPELQYLEWLDVLIERVKATKDQAEREADAKAKG